MGKNLLVIGLEVMKYMGLLALAVLCYSSDDNRSSKSNDDSLLSNCCVLAMRIAMAVGVLALMCAVLALLVFIACGQMIPPIIDAFALPFSFFF